MGFVNNLVSIFTDKRFIYVVIVVLIFIIVLYFTGQSVRSQMRKSIYIGPFDFDFWALSHLLLYIYFGYQFPNMFWEFLAIGTAWEGFETIFCPKTLLDTIGMKRNKGEEFGCGYWYGKLTDIPVNMFGFVIGAAFSKKK